MRMGVNCKRRLLQHQLQITGLSGLPEAGEEFIVVKNEKEAREIAKRGKKGRDSLVSNVRSVSLSRV